MASFSDTLTLVDQVTPILRQIYSQTIMTADATRVLQDTVSDPVASLGYDAMSQQLTASNTELQGMIGKMEEIKAQQSPINSGFEQMKSTIIAANQAFQLAQMIAGKISATISGFVGAANESITAQTRLATIASQASGASAEQLSHLKAVAEQYSRITTYEDDALIAGLSELATYRLSVVALEQMTETLADYAAGQAGVTANSWQMTQLANQLGKALDGNYGGLTKIGFTFTDLQKKIIETGTEMERVAVLSEVIGESYGGLAEALRQTPEGQAQALANAWGNVHEEIGLRLLPAMGMLNVAQLNLVDALDPAEAEGFFSTIYTGAQLVGMVLGAPINAVAGFIDLFNKGNIPIRFLFYTTIGAGAAYVVPLLWSVGAAGVSSAVATISAWAVANAPFIAAGAAIGLVITMLGDLGVTAEDIAGLIGGTFYAMGAGIYDVFAGISNFFIWLANGASQLGAMFGIGDGSQFDYMEYKDLAEAYSAGDTAGRGLYKGLTDVFQFNPDDFGAGGYAGMPIDIDSVGEVEKINEPVNLAAEDLRYLLDERERRYVANVNLSSPAPTLQLTIENVNNAEDLDAFMDKAGKKLREMAEANIIIVPG